MQAAKSIPRTLARNTIASWLSYFVSGGCALVLTPLVIKGCWRTRIRRLDATNALTGYAGVLDLSVQPAIVNYVAQSRATGDREGLHTLLSTALCLQLCIALLIVGLLFGLSFLVENWFDLGGVNHQEARTAPRLMAFSAAIGFPASVFSALESLGYRVLSHAVRNHMLRSGFPSAEL